MTGVCLTCGRISGDIEAHHPAGRCNVPDLVVPVCVGCHQTLTAWAAAAGIELRSDADRGPLDRRRALLIGGLHLVQLAARHAPESGAGGPELWRLAARAISRLLDQHGAADRPGRWLPDAAALVPEPVPCLPDPAGEPERLCELGCLIGELLRLLGDLAPLTADAWDVIMANTGGLAAAFGGLDQPEHAGPALCAAITENLDATRQAMLRLLTIEDWTVVDERELDEVRVWAETTEVLLTKIVAHALAHQP